MKNKDIATALKSITLENKAMSDIFQNEEVKLAVLTLIQLFNCCKITKDSIQAKSETAELFLNSLAIYLENNFPIISSWANKSNYHDMKYNHLLSWGKDFTYELEYKRFQNLRSTKATSNVDIILFIIKCKVQNKTEPQFLLQLNTDTLMYQLIGGYLSKNETIEQAAARFLKDELPGNTFKYTLRSVAKQSLKNVSYRSGALTEYTVKLVHIEIKEDHIFKLTNIELWLPISALKRSQTKDGIMLITPLNTNAESDTDIEELLQNLSLSTTSKQNDIDKKIQNSQTDSINNSIAELLSQEESEILEFKSSIRWDYRQAKVNKGLEKVILKTLGAFLNSNGGTLLIGVDDDKNVLGIEKDISTLQKKDEDGLMLHLISIINSYIGVEFNSLIHIIFRTINNKKVCLIKTQKAPRPVFVKNGEQRDFFIRSANSSKALNPEETYKYIQLNF